ncbi:MAG: flagellar basal body-associated FliL family protein [Smithella sp.]
MVEKAKLDLLENPSEIKITEATIQADEKQELPVPATKGKWALNKLVLIVAPVMIVVLVITGVLLFYLIRTKNNVSRLKSDTVARTPAVVIDNKRSESAVATATGGATEQTKINNVHYKDFIIDLKDKTGKSRILMCDVVFNISEAGNIAELENREDVRSLIYQTLTGRNAVVLRSLEERKKLKKELMQEAVNVLGEGIVKNIYFTNYVIM